MTDTRGDDLLELSLRHDVSVINSPNSPPTFENSIGRSWIDVTILGQALLREVIHWEVLEEYNSSDHKFISLLLYDIFTNPSIVSP